MENNLPKAERTRKFIIQTTAGIFNTKGYAGTALSDLTEATNLTKGSIYGNFASKEEVALAVFDHNLDTVTKLIREQMGKAETFSQKLMVYVRVYHDHQTKPFPEGGCPILNTAIEADDTNELLKERAAKAILRWKRGIINLVQAGMDAREFKAGNYKEQFAISLMALIEGALMIAKVTDEPNTMDAITKTALVLINTIKN